MKRKKISGLGKTGTYSEGKIHSSDEGDIKFAIAADAAHGVVLIDFGTPVVWMGISPETAKALAAILIEKADKVSKTPQ